jgi:hypothetical protein
MLRGYSHTIAHVAAMQKNVEKCRASQNCVILVGSNPPQNQQELQIEARYPNLLESA